MEVILHCSDSAFGNAVMIDQWHAVKGWKNPDGIHIGYQLVILNGNLTGKSFFRMLDGRLETGRELGTQGAHTVGHNSPDNIGICLIGKSGKFTAAQLETLGSVLLDLWAEFGKIHVSQHADHDPVNRPYCAGFTADQMKSFNTA